MKKVEKNNQQKRTDLFESAIMPSTKLSSEYLNKNQAPLNISVIGTSSNMPLSHMQN